VPFITFGIPFLFVLIKHESYIKNQSFRQLFIFLFKLCLCWILGYVLTWAMKIIILSTMDTNIVLEFIEQIKERTNGGAAISNFFDLRYVTVYRNLKAMFFEINPVPTLVILFFAISGWLIFKKKNKFSSAFYIYIIVSIIPYLWYIFATEHSLMHYPFTYRLQMMTVLGFLLAYRESIDMGKVRCSYSMMREKIFSRKNKRKIDI
jgi:hypothetical protein